jgi:hypothetical protein
LQIVDMNQLFVCISFHDLYSLVEFLQFVKYLIVYLTVCIQDTYIPLE